MTKNTLEPLPPNRAKRFAERLRSLESETTMEPLPPLYISKNKIKNKSNLKKFVKDSQKH